MSGQSMTWYEAQTPLGDTSRLKTNPLFRLEPVMWKFDPVNFGTVEIDMAPPPSGLRIIPDFRRSVDIMEWVSMVRANLTNRLYYEYLGITTA